MSSKHQCNSNDNLCCTISNTSTKDCSFLLMKHLESCFIEVQNISMDIERMQQKRKEASIAQRGGGFQSNGREEITNQTATNVSIWAEIEFLRSENRILKQQLVAGQERERKLCSELTIERDLRNRQSLSLLAAIDGPHDEDACDRNERNSDTSEMMTDKEAGEGDDTCREREEEIDEEPQRTCEQQREEEIVYITANDEHFSSRAALNATRRRESSFSLPNVLKSKKDGVRRRLSSILNADGSSDHENGGSYYIGTMRLYTEEEVSTLLERLSSRAEEIRDLEKFVEGNTKIIHAMQYQMQNVNRFFK